MTTAAQDALLIWLEPRFLDLAGSPLGSARAGNHAFGKTGARLFCIFSIVSLVTAKRTPTIVTLQHVSANLEPSKKGTTILEFDLVLP
jgi:hypothetical protein